MWSNFSSWIDSYQHFIAGFCGGITSTLVCHPFDLLKIRFSANDGSVFRPNYKGYLSATRAIINARGLAGLYQGLSANVIGAALSWGLYFEFFHELKNRTKSYATNTELLNNFLLGIASGGLVLALTNPIWVCKTKLCLQYEKEVVRQYSGFVNCIYSLAKNGGFKSLYQGFTPGLIGTSHGALQFMLYNYMKDTRIKQLNVPPSHKLDTLEYLMFSTISKLIATTITFPYQVMRTRMQDSHASYKGLVDLIVKMYRNEGIHSFYKGFLIGNLRQLPATVTVFFVYENVMSFLRQLS